MLRKTIFTFAIIAAGAVFAQTTTPTTPPTPPTPEQRIAKRVEFLTTVLSLATGQATQATAIYTDEYNSANALQASLKAARTQLHTDIQNVAGQSAVEADVAALGALNMKADTIHANAQLSFRRILTADQRTKLDALNQGGPGFGGHGGPGGFGGPGAFGGPAGRRAGPRAGNQ